MNNVEVSKSNEPRLRIVHRQSFKDAVEVLYACNTGCGDILGCASMIFDYSLISINQIREDNEIEKDMGIDFKPWGIGSIIACEEGLYAWESIRKDYVLIGQIKETLRIQRIIVKQDYYAEAFMMFDKKIETVFFKCGEIYELIDTIDCRDEDSDYDFMIVLQNERTSLITPYDKEKQQLQTKDLVKISFYGLN